MTQDDEQTTAFLNWFAKYGGTLHSAVGVTQFPKMGRGAVALEDIEKNTVLFTLPRSLTLSLRTCTLPQVFGDKAWKKHKLNRGWVGLILCLLWERANGEEGKWHYYLETLPSVFNTPMFWGHEDLAELKGTSIYDKIGKTQAEDDYNEVLIPAIKTRPDLFDPNLLSTHYSLEKYHLMGSRILSRSFHVEEEDLDGDKEEEAEDEGETVPESHVAEDEMDQDVDDNDDEDEDDVDYDSDEENPADVAMVPMADILNARYKSENAKLNYESRNLEMIATRDIKKGEQIFNTYGDPPNSDLLRRYGHVDLLELNDGSVGNPGDVVEIRADLVVDAFKQVKVTDQKIYERIDWWLNMGDDVYNFGMDDGEIKTPGELISFIRVLIMPDAEWTKTQSKGKIPKSKMDSEVADILKKTLELRLKQYQTTLEEDQSLLRTEMSENKRLAVVVRMGEKRILHTALKTLSLTAGANPGTDTRKTQKRVSSNSVERDVRKVPKKR